MTQEHKYLKRIVKGSFHQGDTSIFSRKSVGKQCVPNCAIAALYTSIIPLYRWTSDILDKILKCGDKLYHDIYAGNDFLQVHEIGKEICMYNNLYAFQIRHEYFGRIHNESALNTVNMTLEKATFCALQKSKKCQWVYCILCVGNQNGATSSLLCLSQNTCYIFDPHSRNSCGQPVPDGTSVLMMFENRQKMISYLRDLYSLSKYPTTMQNEVPIDIYSMCHIDFHVINTTLYNYLVDQNYFTFCSTNENGKIDRKNYDSPVLHNTCGERFVPETVLHERKRDKVKEEREKKKDRMKKVRENIRTANRQKRDATNASRHKCRKQTQKRYRKRCLDTANASREKYNCSTKTKTSPELVSPNVCSKQSTVLHNTCRERFASETVLHKRKRDKVKEERENKRDRMKKMREKIRTANRQKRDATNASGHKCRKQTQKRYRKRCLDTANASREKYNCSTKTKTSPELVSPNVCSKPSFPLYN